MHRKTDLKNLLVGAGIRAAGHVQWRGRRRKARPSPLAAWLTPVTALLLGSTLLAGCGAAQGSTFSGIIEGTEIPIQTEVGGTVQSLPVAEGASVKKGQLLVALDDQSYQLQVQGAQAGVDAALAALRDAQAGSRAQEIAAAMAAVDQTRALADQSAANSKAAGEQVNALIANQSQLMSNLKGAQDTLAYQQQQLARVQALQKAGAATQQQVDAAQQAVNQAQTQVDNLQAQLQGIQAQIRQAQNAQAAAQSGYASALANERSAQAKLDLLKAGATDQHLKQLIAMKDQADAKLAEARRQLEKTRVTAPEDGVFLRRDVEVGQVVKPGATLGVLLKKDELKVVIYVPEADLGRVKLGQPAAIRVDAYPGETFSGRVSVIADRAEFTPKNVQTPDERAKMVFAVTVEITSGLDRLRAGMPADVVLGGPAGGAS
ncbi:efflux RND transporter periplasmic adaptor subunit [Kyrpidia sp.]|uniref:HlyD family secretion protein n=1 Tax=Kyrpidia sp. TaxID=2073077 RepID=UPI00258F8FA6|nr:efflux RND transporter periplasmic adaptor subunit [Kyrpidia sp.]MCL6576725.1 efflux RND transporter periplasmic adaptor subunit [Kyrpidia sp.]